MQTIIFGRQPFNDLSTRRASTWDNTDSKADSMTAGRLRSGKQEAARLYGREE